MCNENRNTIFEKIFSQEADEFNWLTNSLNNVRTENGKIILKASNNTEYFKRKVGAIDVNSDRVRVTSNIELKRTQESSESNICVVFALFSGEVFIEEFRVFANDVSESDTLKYFFDRTYKYEELNEELTLRIKFEEGFKSEIMISDLKVENFKYCSDKVKVYFALKDVFKESLLSRSAAIILKEYKIDNQETLTQDFFNDNSQQGTLPKTNWLFAKSEIDGTNRVSETAEPNTFNPFVKEFGLEYDALNYYDGTPIGTTNGKDYGPGVLNFGFDKPEVMNEDLISQKGAFFLNIDFTKNLRVVFDVVVNKNSSSLFQSPQIYRTYYIIFDKEKCQRRFYYRDNLQGNIPFDEEVNGFLSGLTDFVEDSEVLNCDESFSFSGQSGTFETQIDFGTATGECGILCSPYSVPDKFQIEWDGNVYSSGYIGQSSYEQRLLNEGIPQNEINLTSGSVNNFPLLFQKNKPYPTKAKILVTAPLSGTAWALKGKCPDGVVVNPGNGTTDVIVAETQDESTCQSTFKVRVNVPNGEQRRVAITGLFGQGADYSLTVPYSNATLVETDIDQTITETKSFKFGIDADNSQGSSLTESSVITVEVFNGTNLEETKSFRRIHSNKKCFLIPQ